MSETITKPTAAKPAEVNRVGAPATDYKGAASTLCKGCGHDAITSHIVHSAYEYGVDPYMVAKVSGIGCSSKTTAYLLGKSHGFNGVHGRPGALATGANLANRQLVPLALSGDGDTAAIGLSQFLNMVRQNVRVIYIIENNGVYGLTRGQFSSTSEEGAALRSGTVNHKPAVDCCVMAIEMGCEYVARSFSGDAKQLRALLKGALAHNGTAVLDVVSPCVTFNNHEGSPKSYKYVQDHDEPLHEIGFVPFFDPITVDYEEGKSMIVEMYDGSKIVLKKLAMDYDPTDKIAALSLLEKAKEEKQLLTGLLYHGNKRQSLPEQENLVDEPLATLPESRVRPSPQALEKLMNRLR